MAKTKLVYWQHVAQSRVDAVNVIIQEFEQQNPDITVQFQPLEWGTFFDRIVTALATNTGPDVFQMPVGEAERYIASGLLQPLDLTPEEARREFLPWTVERLISGGMVWGLPTDIQTIMLFYNRDLFSQAGLDPEVPPADWAQVVDYAKKLTRRNGEKMVQAGISACCYSVTLEDSFFKAGASLYDEKGRAIFTSEPAIRAITYLTDFPLTHRVSPVGTVSWVQGTVAMVYGHPVAMGDWHKINPDLPFQAAIGPPAERGKEPTTVGTHWEYFIARKAPTEEATRWVRFLASRRGQETFFRVAGDLVARWDLLRNPDLHKNPNRALALESLLHSRPITWRGWTQPVQLYTESMTRVVSGGVSPLAAATWLEQQMRAYLSNLRIPGK